MIDELLYHGDQIKCANFIPYQRKMKADEKVWKIESKTAKYKTDLNLAQFWF